MALAALPSRLSGRALELAKLNAEVDKFTVDTINHLKSLRLRIDGLEGAGGPLTGLATIGPETIQATDPKLVGTSTRAAREDHQHDISTQAPSRGIGAGNTTGVNNSLARSDHDHTIRETSGPSDMTVGSIQDGEAVRRIGTALVGRQFEVVRLTANATTTSTTSVDVSSDLSFSLIGGRNYAFLWVAFYQTAATTTGMLMAANFNAGLTALRYGTLQASAATALFSNTTSANNTLLGQTGVGPGGTSRVGLMGGIYRPSANGTLTMRYASGVAASQVQVDINSFAVLIQL